jgi:hypothetical protein
MPYAAMKKPGLRGRIAVFRALLLDGDEVVAEVSGLQRAEQIANLLNSADAGRLPPRKQSDAEYSHYKATVDYSGRPIVLRAGWGEVQQIMATSDTELARRVADLLERVDPAKKIRKRLGIGWW